MQAGSGDAVGRFGGSGAGGPDGFLPGMLFRRGAGADLRRRTAQMAKDGHLIGVHCMAHVDLARQPIEKSVEEIRETADWIEAVTGKRPEYIRPPYGSWSTELQERVSMTPVFWDVDTLDWKSRNTARIVKHICKNAAVHTVVLMHDAYQTSVDAALETIDTLTAEGYTFVTIEECLID